MSKAEDEPQEEPAEEQTASERILASIAKAQALFKAYPDKLPGQQKLRLKY